MAARSGPRVLALVDWYLPGEKAGGPVRSIDALVHRLAGQAHFDVVARDRDLGDRRPYPDVTSGVWVCGDLERRRYLRPRDARPLAMLRLLRRTPHDVLYLNTLYSAPFALYPLILRRLRLLRRKRVLLAPRGQLDPGALTISATKKRAYLRILSALGLFGNVEWHASSAGEAAHIRGLVPGAAIHVAPNLRCPTDVPERAPSPSGGVRLVFLSRISPKKNLDAALQILADCAAPISFDIYGELEDLPYWRRCRDMIDALPANVTCRYHGAVPHADVGAVLASYDVLLLPTRAENFGHVIAEALEAGCLPLVSDRTPWRGLTSHNAGWDLPLDDLPAFSAAIERYAALDQDQRVLRRARARELASLRDDDAGNVAANLRLFEQRDGSPSSAIPAAERVSGRRLLLLSPSTGLSGGIERVMDAIQEGWDGPVDRVDLVRGPHPGGTAQPTARVGPSTIAGFTGRAFATAGRSRPDVVVCGLLGLLPVAAAVAQTFRRELALLAYGVDVWGRVGPLERVLVRRCTRLLAISSFTAQTFAARVHIDRRDIDVLTLPIAARIAAAAQHAIDDHADRAPLVLTVARVARSDRFKGHFDIARSFGLVLERHPDARWVVVGDGDDLAALRAECHRLGIEDAVTFTGRIPDAELIALYRSAAVFALPSFADADADPPVGEGFGLVYAEAGAFGLPIVAAEPGGGSAEFITDEDTGLTVSPNAPVELAAAILRLLDDAQLRTALGQRARERALARHLPAHFRKMLNRSLP